MAPQIKCEHCGQYKVAWDFIGVEGKCGACVRNEIHRLRSPLSAAEKELQEERLLTKAARERAHQMAESADKYRVERDTALRERDRLRDQNKRVWAILNGMGIGMYTESESKEFAALSVIQDIRTALGCPDLPVEELAGKVGEAEKLRSNLEMCYRWFRNMRSETVNTKVDMMRVLEARWPYLSELDK